MRLYIAGPVTGRPHGNWNAFIDAELILTTVGYEVTNPRRNGEEGDRTWTDFMKISLRQISECDGVAYLTGYQDSRGASIEVNLARDIGMPVRSVADWTTGEWL